MVADRPHRARREPRRRAGRADALARHGLAIRARGAGFAILGVLCIATGYQREREIDRALREGRFATLDPRINLVLTTVGVILGVLHIRADRRASVTGHAVAAKDVAEHERVRRRLRDRRAAVGRALRPLLLNITKARSDSDESSPQRLRPLGQLLGE